MRISKKFVGSNYNGKQIYTRRTGADRLSNEAVKERRAKLCGLEQKFLAKIAPGGGARRGGNSAAVASSNMPTATQQMQPSFQDNNNHAASQLASVLSLQNLAQGGGSSASVRNSGIDLRSLLNHAAVNQNNGGNNNGNNTNSDLPRTLSMLSASLNGGNNDPTSASSQSLQNLFQELVKSTSNQGGLDNIAHAVGANSTDSLQAFQAMFQQQQQQTQQANQAGGGAPKSNSRAAAAGRALLGGLGGGGHHTSAPSAAPPQKDISSFTSAELAAELRKRSSLQDFMATLTGGTDNKPVAATNVSAASFHDTLQQAAEVNSLNAFSSLLRNSAVDMSNLVERQGSIDSLSNLAIRSRLQSIQSSMGSLLDPLLDNASSSAAAKNNSTWNPAGGASSYTSAGNAMNLPNLKSLAARVSQGSIEPRSANDLMESFGMNRTSLGNLANTNTGNSGLHLASLLNNEDALRRLNTSAPSSLHQNFQENHSGGIDSGRTASGATSEANNTAIAQFLLQKQLLDQAGSDKQNDQQRLMTNVTAAVSGGSSGGNSGGMDPAMMSTLLSQLRSAGKDGQQQDEGGMEALKRKFFSQEASTGTQQDEQRRNKPFR